MRPYEMETATNHTIFFFNLYILIVNDFLLFIPLMCQASHEEPSSWKVVFLKCSFFKSLASLSAMFSLSSLSALRQLNRANYHS